MLQHKKCGKQSRAAGQRNLPPIQTACEVFADGGAIELVRDRKSGGLNLLYWDGNRATVAPRFEHNHTTYVPAELDASIVRVLTLPTCAADYESTRKLFDALRKLATGYNFPEETGRGFAYFACATWFLDCLPTAPYLSIVGQGGPEATLLLQLLQCVCRRPLLLADLSTADFSELPIHLGLTLLIGQADPSRLMRRLLRVSSQKNALVLRKGKLLDLFSAKAVYWGADPPHIPLTDAAVQITLTPTARKLPILNEGTREAIAREFQPRMQMYRLLNLSKVRRSEFDVPEFASATRVLAHSLGACIIDDRELQVGTIDVLRAQDEDIRVRRSTELESVVIEALLFFCHDGQHASAYVGKIATVVNSILKGRAEILELDPRGVGDQLRALGLYTRRLGGAGRGILLLDAVRRKIHDLAYAYDVPSIQDGVVRCPHCTVRKPERHSRRAGRSPTYSGTRSDARRAHSVRHALNTTIQR